MCSNLLAVSSVQCHAVLCARAADVSRVQLFSFVPFHVAAWSLHVCSDTGLQPLSTTKHWGQKRVRFSLQLHLKPPVLLSFIFNLKPFRIRIKPIFIFYLYLLLISLICITSAIPRSSCGPFRNEQTMFNVTGKCVKSLPSPAQTTIRYLTSEAFALPLILAEM